MSDPSIKMLGAITIDPDGGLLLEFNGEIKNSIVKLNADDVLDLRNALEFYVEALELDPANT